ncbi:MAG: Succinyl-CoA ligase [ADP-forming] subunit alpha [ANME-2 cluster archaeon HR1]|jgi:acetyltransferase|nr:MAG: Succinyl-CoA ligase [ADP-forming] subunit alpha [ANME-2 cluster archaeon HR1]
MLEELFEPSSIAIIGASRDPKKPGGAILANLIKEFEGNIYPVNPKSDMVQGFKCYHSVDEVPSAELAVIVIPAGLVPDTLKQCSKKDTKNVVIISAGFKESGPEGAILEKQIIDISRDSGIRILGPNCLGLLNTHNGMNATFAAGSARKGNIAIMSQSGALCTSILDWAASENIGFSKFLSLGNKADIAENDLLDSWSHDDETDVILAYLEGIKDGQQFIRTAREATKRKPVVVIKSGRTSTGSKAAASHTGTLAGSDRAYTSAFDQSGVIRAYSMEELFDYSRAFSTQPLPEGFNVAIITNAGGPGIMAADACEEVGLRLASFKPETIDKLRHGLPPQANIYNPIDVLGDATSQRYDLALEAAMSDPIVDGIIVLVSPQAMTDVEQIAQAVIRTSGNRTKPIVTSLIGGNSMVEGDKILDMGKVPNYPYPGRAAKALSVLAKYRQYKEIVRSPYEQFDVDENGVRSIIDSAINEGIYTLGVESLDILACYGIPTVRSIHARTIEEALQAAEKIGYPVAMKIVSPDISHKSDVGGVKINIKDEKELTFTYTVMRQNIGRILPDARIKGVQIQEMRYTGKEIIVGMHKDAQFGPMLMFGLGGIYVDILKDVSFAVAPINRDDANKMIQQIRSFPLLTGVRGEEASDIDSIVDSLLRLSQLACDFPEIVELDINPLFVYARGKGCVAPDFRIILEERK